MKSLSQPTKLSRENGGASGAFSDVAIIFVFIGIGASRGLAGVAR
ncbi:hypothetical protein OAG90_00615 [bacterium]|nr:hypothetical protein [bacterium]